MTQLEYFTTVIAVIVLSVSLAYLIYELMTRKTNHEENLFCDRYDRGDPHTDTSPITQKPEKKKRIWGKVRRKIDRDVRDRRSRLLFGESIL